jgi:hypothetical protein
VRCYLCLLFLLIFFFLQPWNDYPPRWGKLWPGKAQTDSYKGYTLSDAVDMLYSMRAFYNAAESIWGQFGPYYCTGRLGYEDFVQVIIRGVMEFVNSSSMTVG